MTVRAKMQCHVNEGNADMGKEVGSASSYASVRLGAVYEGWPEGKDGAATENAIFGRATPCGEVSMQIANPAAAAFFKPGKKYYVDFTEAPD